MIKPGIQIAIASALSDNVFEGVLDISDLRSASIQVSGTFSLTLLVEVSNDLGENPNTWDTIETITTTGIYSIPLAYRSLRLRCSSYTSGSADIAAIFSKEQPIEKTPATEAKQDALIGNYAIRLDDTTTAGVTYVGKAAIGSSTASAVWQIKKIDESSGMAITWADGDANFDNVWDNRATTETYS